MHSEVKLLFLWRSACTGKRNNEKYGKQVCFIQSYGASVQDAMGLVSDSKTMRGIQQLGFREACMAVIKWEEPCPAHVAM